MHFAYKLALSISYNLLKKKKVGKDTGICLGLLTKHFITVMTFGISSNLTLILKRIFHLQQF